MCEAYEYVGYRLAQPEECPMEIYKLMLWCWKATPEERPNFGQILEEIERIQKPEINEENNVKFAKKLSEEEEILYN